jgi:hypothetical protein
MRVTKLILAAAKGVTELRAATPINTEGLRRQ